MHTRQWKAVWTGKEGEEHSYTFYAPDHRGVVGIDFRLELLEQGRAVPEAFLLEEGCIIPEEYTQRRR